MTEAKLTPETWSTIIAGAYALFDALESQGFGRPPFSLGGGTVLMFHFEHRLSKDIDFFGYDAQWLSLLSPRLNDAAAAMAAGYVEQANTIKIMTPHGDIDFIIAGDVTASVDRVQNVLAGREILVDPVSEILAKKLFYRATHFKARDVYDLSAAIDLNPDAARTAVQAAASRKDILLRRLSDLAEHDEAALLNGIVPYEGALRHADDMLSKVTDFIAREAIDPKARPSSGNRSGYEP